jgi:putative ABC transport system permease protein
MLRRSLEIIGSSFKMALQELWKNKLRTTLSLFGIMIGIFCLIGVLVVVNSLERNIQNEIKSLGTNTIYIDKWDYSAGGGPDYPWWKYVNRPVPKYEEVEQIKRRTGTAKYAAFAINIQDNLEYAGNVLSNVKMYGVSDDFEDIQPFEMQYGRYFSEAEFERGVNIAVIGFDIAEKLFGNAEVAVGKLISARGKTVIVGGVIKKQGKQMIGGWDFDQSMVLPYRYAHTIMNELRSDPVIMVQGNDNITSKSLKDDLTGTMRALHKLSPTKEEDFSLNDVNDFSDAISSAFSGLNIGGWAIAALSLIVGMFGVANIMFVSVRERTSQIGLKKAVGAKRRVILAEFLIESAFLCIIGGLIGLLLVFVLAQVLTKALNFPVFVSTDYMILAILICIITGILAGFIPALQAAKMDPVVAIRSK